MVIYGDVSLPPFAPRSLRGSNLRGYLVLRLDDGPRFARGDLAPVHVPQDVVALLREYRVDARSEMAHHGPDRLVVRFAFVDHLIVVDLGQLRVHCRATSAAW